MTWSIAILFNALQIHILIERYIADYEKYSVYLYNETASQM
jgi:hypothetical protein